MLGLNVNVVGVFKQKFFRDIYNMTKNDYYYFKSGKQFGPIDINNLREMIAKNELTSTDLVWFKSSPSWVKAGSLQELFPTEEVTPPDLDQAIVYPHNENPKDSWKKNDVKWYLIGVGGIFIGLVLLAITSRSFQLVKTRSFVEEGKKMQSEIFTIMKDVEKTKSDAMGFVKDLENNAMKDVKTRKPK